MKKLYWRPQRLSLRVLTLIGLLAGCGMVAVETLLLETKQPFYAEKLEAARLAQRAFELLKREREARGIPIDPEVDPARSGLIGVLISPVTTNPGHLAAKQSTVNPNFAAVVVHMLARARVKPGDTVAVGMSGSFPALNVAVHAALHVLRTRPIIIASVGSSQFGANHPDFTWPEMERVLHRHRIAVVRAVALSRGGVEDRAVGMGKQGKQLLDLTIARAGGKRIYDKTFQKSLDRRMAIYREAAAGAPIKAYINVGGGTVSVGTVIGKRMFRPGLTRKVTNRGALIDSVMTRFARLDVPVIHLSNIGVLVARYGLAPQPRTTPPPGRSTVFVRRSYNTWLAAAVLAAVVLMLLAFVRLDWGYRLLSRRREPRSSDRPEQMV